MLEDIYNFLALSENLFTGGMPKAEQLTDAAQRGVEVVVNLASHNAPHALANEEALVSSLGMQYVNIPINWSTPTKDGLDRFLASMEENKDKKILVHCQSSFWATALVTLYRIRKQGWNTEDAVEAMPKIWDEEDYPMWKLFIENTLKRSQKGSWF